MWTQHLLVLLAAAGCASFIGWQGIQSLRGRKSKLNGCGTCGSCDTDTAKETRGRATQIVPVELLRRKR